ncbi:MAG TPA: hypothetical protein VGF53_02515 [Pseudolabrys sp.]|jgi:hypothetical protein
MNVARNLLDDLATIGAMIEPAGDRLILHAGPTAIPATLVSRVREAKADLLATLAAHNDLAGEELTHVGGPQSLQVKTRTFETFIVEWLNQNPAPSPVGRCAWCGQSETDNAVVLPFGTEPGTHAWLHAECWASWQEARRAQAVRLAFMGS